MQLTEIIDVIEKVAPLSAQASWDCSGMQVASHRTTASTLAVCLDPTPAAVSAALQRGAQCIVSHHPLMLSPRLPRRLDAYHEVLRLLLREDVPLYACHTSLDVNSAGPAAWVAEELGLTGRTVIEPVASGPAPAFADTACGLPLGFGLAGDLPAPMSPASILQQLGRWIDLSTATLCGPQPEMVRRIGYCTGSGSSLLAAARACGVEFYITGDVKYHTALDAEICMADVGHHSLEEEMMRRMSLLLQQRLPRLAVFFVPSVSPLRPLDGTRNPF